MNPYLELITGPMKSGKTSRLIELFKKYTDAGIKVLAINSCLDNRFLSNGITSHTGENIPAISALNISDVINLITLSGDYLNQFLNAKVILINEGQFFEDIFSFVRIAVERYDKRVYVCGLNCDYRRNSFLHLLELEILADKVTHLKGICQNCKEQPSLFSYRLSDDKEKILIGSKNYMPVCRSCYLYFDNKNYYIMK